MGTWLLLWGTLFMSWTLSLVNWCASLGRRRENVKVLEGYCNEFLVHGVDVEGKRCGIDVRAAHGTVVALRWEGRGSPHVGFSVH